MKRLRNQWPGAYGEERTLILWNAFKDASDTVFGDAVSECLGTCRQAPLLPELERAVEIGRTREKESYARRGDGSVMGVLDHAARSRAQNPDFVKVCLAALDHRHKARLSPDSSEWQEILVHLGRSCGMNRHQSLFPEGTPPVPPMRFTSGRDRAAGKDE